MKKLKKSLSLLLALVMVLSVMSVGAFADGNVAKIGTTEYATLAEAVADVPTNGTQTTIELLNDASVTETLRFGGGKDIVINLNNYSVVSSARMELVGAKLEFTGTGCVKRAENSTDVLLRLAGSVDPAAEDYTVLTIGKNVTMQSPHYALGMVSLDKNDYKDKYGVVVTCSGKIESEYGISINGTFGMTPTVFTFTETSKLVGGGVYAAGASVWNLAGDIEGESPVYIKSGTVNITGGTYTSTGTKQNYQYKGSGFESTGDAVVIDNCGYPGGAPVVNISGGTFTSANAKAVGSYAYNKDSTTSYEPLTGFITGGTFNDLSALDYLGENANVTIKLTDDVALDSTLNIEAEGKTITLDLNQHTLTGRTNLKAGNLTIENGNIVCMNNQPLNVYGSDTSAENYSVLTIADDVTVTGGNFGVCMFGKTATTNGYGAVINLVGTVNTTGSGAEGAIFVSGNLGNYVDDGFNNNVINITGKITSQLDTPLALNGLAQVNIEDGAELTGNTAVAIKRGFLNVKGGTLTSNGKKYDPPAVNNSGTEMSGAGISMTNTYNQYGPMAVNVSGGTIISENADAIYKQNASYANAATITITGGTFNKEVAEGYLAAGYKVEQSGDDYVVSPKITTVNNTTAVDTSNETVAAAVAEIVAAASNDAVMNASVSGSDETLPLTVQVTEVKTDTSNSNKVASVTYEITPPAGYVSGKTYTVPLVVPSNLAVDGATVWAKHADDKAQSVTVTDGVVTIAVTSFSPFILSTTNPDAGNEEQEATADATILGMNAYLADYFVLNLYVKTDVADPQFAFYRAYDSKNLDQVYTKNDFLTSNKSVVYIEKVSDKGKNALGLTSVRAEECYMVSIKIFTRFLDQRVTMSMTDGGTELNIKGYSYGTVGSNAVAKTQSYSLIDYFDVMQQFKGQTSGYYDLYQGLTSAAAGARKIY